MTLRFHNPVLRQPLDLSNQTLATLSQVHFFSTDPSISDPSISECVYVKKLPRGSCDFATMEFLNRVVVNGLWLYGFEGQSLYPGLLLGQFEKILRGT